MLLPVAVTVGGPTAPRGVARTSLDGVPGPATFKGATVKRYGTPTVRPVIVVLGVSGLVTSSDCGDPRAPRMRCVVALAIPVASTTSVNREWVSAASNTSYVFSLALALVAARTPAAIGVLFSRRRAVVAGWN
jgi:hypothetical protein